MKKKCKRCKELKEHHAKGYCLNCYSLLRYHNNPEVKKLIIKRSREWEKNNYKKYCLSHIKYWKKKLKDFKNNKGVER